MVSRLLAVLAVAVLGACGLAWANTSHAGWPAIQNLLIDKDPTGGAHVLYGRPGVHNELLGGYGSDTIYGGNAGDVIWTNLHPNFQLYDPTHRYCPSLREYIGSLPAAPATPADVAAARADYAAANAACRARPRDTGQAPATAPPPSVGTVHAGNGDNFIYATDTTNFVWTGTGRTMVHASVGGGVIHCQSRRVIVFLSHNSRRHYKLPGCRHLSYFSVGY